MDRLLTFWRKYRSSMDPKTLPYLREVCTMQAYHKGDTIKLPDQHLPYLCIVLEGVVGGYEAAAPAAIGAAARPKGPEQAGNPQLRELILPLDYFTGTPHPFSRRNRHIEYRALTQTTLIRMSISQASEGQHRCPDLAELFQVMKQRKIDQLRKQIAIFQEKDHYLRYCLYRQLLPQWAYLLPHRVQHPFLQISKPHYHRIKTYYLRNFKKQ